jgi:hypothetical protein
LGPTFVLALGAFVAYQAAVISRMSRSAGLNAPLSADLTAVLD